MENKTFTEKVKIMLSNLKNGEESLQKLKEKYKYNTPNEKNANKGTK